MPFSSILNFNPVKKPTDLAKEYMFTFIGQYDYGESVYN